MAEFMHMPRQAMTGAPGLKPGEVATGTTIISMVFDKGVVVCADTRTSTGSYVANRVTDKLVQLSKYIYCCRSGSAADTQALTDYVRYFISQYELTTGREPTVKTAAHLMRRLIYQNKDQLMAGVIIAGWDPVHGSSCYNIPLGGTMLEMPFCIGGSGSVFISGLLDNRYKENMTKDEALELVKTACAHAMSRDGSSGGCIRTITITEEGTERSFTPGNQLPYGPVGW